MLFEVTALGFNGGDDDTDDRVLWVEAPSEETLTQALADHPYQSWQKLPHDPFGDSSDIDVFLSEPSGRQSLRDKLQNFADNLP